MPPSSPALTPVEALGPFFVKRDDLFEVAGARGGKARTCLALAERAKERGAIGLITAGSKDSPQVNIVAKVGRHLGLRVRAWTQQIKVLTPELASAEAAGADIVRCGSTFVGTAEKKADKDPLLSQGWALIPFGMECPEAVSQTRGQVANLVPYAGRINRLVVPLGSGMSMCGILHGLADHGLLGAFPVVGVRVGRDPTPILDRYAPTGWRDYMEVVDSGLDYAKPAVSTDLHGLTLDSRYEGKCLPFLENGDMLWVVGIRETQTGIANAGLSRRATAPLALTVNPTEIAALNDVASVLNWVEQNSPAGPVPERLRAWAGFDAGYRRTYERLMTAVRLLMGRDLTSQLATGALQKELARDYGLGERQLRYYRDAWVAVDSKRLPVEVLDRPISDIPAAVEHFLGMGSLEGAPMPSRAAQVRLNKKTQPALPPPTLPKPGRPARPPRFDGKVERRSKEVEEAMNGFARWQTSASPRALAWTTPKMLSLGIAYYGVRGSAAKPVDPDERARIEALIDPVKGDPEIRAAMQALAEKIRKKAQDG